MRPTEEMRSRMNTSEGPRCNLKPFSDGIQGGYYKAMKYNHTNDKFTGYSQSGAGSRFVHSRRKILPNPGGQTDLNAYFDSK